jgi:predicted MFS family arabinose efflux permease
MAFLPPLPILIVAGFFLGLSWGPFNPLVSTLIQQRVPADQQGRVFGVQTAVFYAAPPLGMVLAGQSVESFGVSTTYIVLAVILSITAILALQTKSLRSNF